MSDFLLSEAPPEMHADAFRELILQGCTCDPMIHTDLVGVSRITHARGCARGDAVNQQLGPFVEQP